MADPDPNSAAPFNDLAKRGYLVYEFAGTDQVVRLAYVDTGLTTPGGAKIVALQVGGAGPGGLAKTIITDAGGLVDANVVSGQRYGVDNGVAKGAQSGTTLQDTDKTWGVNALQGLIVVAWTEDPTKTEEHAVVSNTANTITITGPWANTPVSGTTHYKVLNTGAAMLVKGAEFSIDAEEINIENIKPGNYKATPPDLSDNQDAQVLLDIKGRTVTNLQVDSTLPSTLQSGNDDVATAGSAEQLNGGVSLTIKRGVLVQAKNSNTGNAYVGGSNVDNANGVELSAGESHFFEVNDVAAIYIDVDTNGEGVKWTAY